MVQPTMTPAELEQLAHDAVRRLDALEDAALRLCDCAETFADRWKKGRRNPLYKRMAPRQIRRHTHEVRTLIGREL